MSSAEDIRKYVETCREILWQRVFQAEAEYLAVRLRGSRDILSVGCGPAIIEAELIKQGFCITGLDVSNEALQYAPDGVCKVVGRAEDMPFPDATFDAAIFIASLQFMEDYRKTLQRTSDVLRPEGKIIVMLLNPGSLFIQKMKLDPASYFHGIRHEDLNEIEKEARRYFDLRSEYFLGINGDDIFESQNPGQAALYVLNGRKTPRRQKEGDFLYFTKEDDEKPTRRRKNIKR
jgi:ubiquinone/menaquinone biosynthesis C-methylase UbiE